MELLISSFLLNVFSEYVECWETLPPSLLINVCHLSLAGLLQNTCNPLILLSFRPLSRVR